MTAVNDKSTVNASLTSNKCNNNSEDNGGGGELKNLKTTVVDIDNGVSSSNNNNNDASKVEGGVNEKVCFCIFNCQKREAKECFKGGLKKI